MDAHFLNFNVCVGPWRKWTFFSLKCSAIEKGLPFRNVTIEGVINISL